MSGLRPCPFCGGDAHVKEVVSACEMLYTVGCSDSECMGHETWLLKPTKEEAIAAWNRRTERTCLAKPYEVESRKDVPMTTDDKRNEIAAKLRKAASENNADIACALNDALRGETKQRGVNEDCKNCASATLREIADLIEPSYKPDAKYEAWYNSLSHYGDERGGPSTIRELIEEIVWTALTVDLGPNGNTDPSTGIDEGGVYTNNLFAEWEREASRLSGGIDRDALLALADEMEDNDVTYSVSTQYVLDDYARRIREACGEVVA